MTGAAIRGGCVAVVFLLAVNAARILLADAGVAASAHRLGNTRGVRVLIVFLVAARTGDRCMNGSGELFSLFVAAGADLVTGGGNPG